MMEQLIAEDKRRGAICGCVTAAHYGVEMEGRLSSQSPGRGKLILDHPSI